MSNMGIELESKMQDNPAPGRNVQVTFHLRHPVPCPGHAPLPTSVGARPVINRRTDPFTKGMLVVGWTLNINRCNEKCHEILLKVGTQRTVTNGSLIVNGTNLIATKELVKEGHQLR